uniref:Nudix hydrolase domain-containing protein n=1 Tax=Leptocylindrus danicus TaxID=163516 RepID=A0A7S2NR84_9STRA
MCPCVASSGESAARNETERRRSHWVSRVKPLFAGDGSIILLDIILLLADMPKLFFLYLTTTVLCLESVSSFLSNPSSLRATTTSTFKTSSHRAHAGRKYILATSTGNVRAFPSQKNVVARNLAVQPAYITKDTEMSFSEATQISLAAQYKISIESVNEGEEVWRFVPIESTGDNESARLSKASLYDKSCKNFSFSIQSLSLTSAQCTLKEKNAFAKDGHDLLSNFVRITLSLADSSRAFNSEDNLLITTLSRLMAQRHYCKSESDGSFAILHRANGAISEVLSNEQLSDANLLFADVSKKSELVEMVDSVGNPLGIIPRDLVHKLNLLHRGIGIVVAKDCHIVQGTSTELPDVYVHQRTSTKRIFPSLYDMFVGGVSEAGEEAMVTASREVAEELGLQRGLDGALSEPLFKCVICTSYNRCIVTVFTYRCNAKEEILKWQEEEVAWGDYVSYPIIEAAAQLSIERLIEGGKWPGKQQGPLGPLQLEYNDGEWKTWDFVPDGLLVWEAWKEWLTHK